MYPPHSDGGYPLLCKEAVEEFRARGHDVLVLTGDMGAPGTYAKEPGVWRIFAYCPDNRQNELKSGHLAEVLGWYRREWKEHGLLGEALHGFKPDVVFVWATKGLSHSLAIALQRTGLPFAAYVCGYWLNHHNQEAHLRRQFQFWRWGHDGALARVKTMLHRFLATRFPVDYVPLRFDALAYNSTPMLAAIHDLDASRSPPLQIVDSSSMDHFRATSLPRVEAPFKLLFVGRLHPSKDPLTLIRALGRLQAERHGAQVSLTLVGWQHDAGYFAELRRAIAALPNPAAVDICEPVSFEQMPALFARHQIVIVPSTVDPLPRVAAEAMAAGLVCIVSDKTGISALLADRQEALIFPAGDDQSLAAAISEVMLDPGLARRLQEDGQRKAVAFFSTGRMIDEMETFLGAVVGRSGAAAGDARRAASATERPAESGDDGHPAANSDAPI